ncbi:hypothetical protein RvY_11797-2 [Ramazzottius varieornatus]|uniref:FLYWCH-type domain-containing protein n=1 Tax=Ramazzottius varieornatus TaxID=947166 RepID=A0A1D1VJB2_RAMVA|nr:hypothetical protein RvY_11797-2 [Ramazzottius varieornatus]
MANESIHDIMVALEETGLVSLASNSPTVVTFIKSSRGGDIAMYGGHTYTKNRNLPCERSYWDCRKKDNYGCKGTITLNSPNDVLSTAEHNHVANVNETKAEEVKANLRERAKKSLTKPRRLLSDLVENIPIKVAGHLPSAHSLTRKARWQRQVHMPAPEKPEDIDLNTYLEKSEVGWDSVLFDSERADPQRIIILKGEVFQDLRLAKTWIMDDTFQIVPKLFHQLYTIHFDHSCGLFPVLFTLLPDKSSATYERLFRAIPGELEAMPFRLDLEEGPKPKSIVIDSERAVINTAGKIFPHARILFLRAA